MKNLFVLLSLAAAVSCRSQQTGPQPTSDPAVYKGVTDKGCAVEVAFGSYGSGIDAKAFEKFESILKEEHITFTSKPIGREGEVRYCLPLEGWKSARKKKLVTRLKQVAHEGQLVSVSVR